VFASTSIKKLNKKKCTRYESYDSHVYQLRKGTAICFKGGSECSVLNFLVFCLYWMFSYNFSCVLFKDNTANRNLYLKFYTERWYVFADGHIFVHSYFEILLTQILYC
jgi:hypothetical protein